MCVTSSWCSAQTELCAQLLSFSSPGYVLLLGIRSVPVDLAVLTAGLRSGNAAHPPLSVTYNFIYRNGQRQQTETADKLTCPWCRVFCFHIYSLLKHMQLNHPRFTFSLTVSFARLSSFYGSMHSQLLH